MAQNLKKNRAITNDEKETLLESHPLRLLLIGQCNLFFLRKIEAGFFKKFPRKYGSGFGSYF